MSTLAGRLESRRQWAARVVSDPSAPERQWARPGEWEDVLDMTEELLRAIEKMPESRQRLIELAFIAGAAFEVARLRASFSPLVDIADRVTAGGDKGAARAHGPRRQRAAKRERWIARFAELRAKFPEAPKKALLGMIEDDTGEKYRTLRRYIKQK